MIYAEMRHESGGDDSYYTLRYLVYCGDNMVGSYGVHFGPAEWTTDGYRRIQRPQDPVSGGYAYGASRDYHQVATERQVEAHKEQQRFYTLTDDEQEAYENEHGWPCAQSVMLDGCCYLPDGPSICDGSGLVEVIVGDDERCFGIAAMMANVIVTVNCALAVVA